MLRIAIIGVGWAGERQVKAIRELGRKVTVACLVDNDTDFLAAKAGELNVDKTYTNYHDALADNNIDAVSICTPHPLHCPMAREAAAAGKHILVEKPMAVTVDEATRMIEAAEANNVKLFVAESLCYTSMSQALRAIIENGQYVGELVAASFVGGFRSPNFGYAGRRDWLTKPDQGGTGTWTLHGIHSMAQLRYVLGEVKTVYMQEHHAASFERPDIEGTMSGTLTLERGLNVSVLQTCEVKLPGDFLGYTLYGDQGIVHASRDGYTIVDHNGNRSERIAWPEAELSEYALEIEAFADYVLDGIEGPTDGTSERRSLAVVQAGYESARSGKPVNLRERFGEL